MYKHQEDIINKDPKKCLLALGTGSGKTRIALSLAVGRTLVVCPKTQKLDGNWERELEKLGKSLELLVVSKEEIKKVWDTLPYFDTVILDESHTMTGVYPDTNRKRIKGEDTPKASAIFWAINDYLEKHNPERIYLCTATPTRTPMAVWGSAELLGHGWDYNSFRSQFYTQVKMNGYARWLQRKDKVCKDKLGEKVRAIGVTGKLDDWVEVPSQVHKDIFCPLSVEQKKVIKTLHVDFPDPLVLTMKTHMVENGILHTDEYTEDRFFKDAKIDKIIDFTYEFDKVIVFAKYRLQIEHIEKSLSKMGIETFVLTGSTKDREKVIADAEDSEKCVFIAQSSISSGYELPSFRICIFASADYVHLNLEQARGRNLRINKLNKNLYIYLKSGEIDQAVWKSLDNKEDFHLSIYSKNKHG